MNKQFFIDTACIAVSEPGNGQTNAIVFRPGLFQNLSRITNDLDYSLLLVKPFGNDDILEKEIIRFCKNEDIVFADVCSKAEVIVKGDNAWLQTGGPSYPDETSDGTDNFYLHLFESPTLTLATWKDVYKTLQAKPRKARVQRKTSETDITCDINLDGSGQNEIQTGLGFFDHMLQQIARHGNMDLFIQVKGDLHIDEHHTIEDVGLAMGSAFSEALGNKKGIERYGFLLPMDDCLAQVALDFGGRPWLVWEADFKREKIGDMPTEMFYHFFKSFSDTAKCNLNIKAEGANEHHKIESIFKGFAKTLNMAVTKNSSNSIPSTKGSL